MRWAVFFESIRRVLGARLFEIGTTAITPATILTVLLIMVGIQIFVFGLIGDLVLSFHRETLDELAAIRQLQESEP